MKRIILGIILGSVILGGCSLTVTSKTAEQKLQENVVTKTGTLTVKSGEEYLLNTEEGIVNITSTKINLENFLKKKITVSGMYSGSTLYVDEIQSP